MMIILIPKHSLSQFRVRIKIPNKQKKVAHEICGNNGHISVIKDPTMQILFHSEIFSSIPLREL